MAKKEEAGPALPLTTEEISQNCHFHRRISLGERLSTQAASHQGVLFWGLALHGRALLTGKPLTRACCHVCTPSDGDAAACTVKDALPPCSCGVKMNKDTVIVIMTSHNFFSISYSSVILAVLLPQKCTCVTASAFCLCELNTIFPLLSGYQFTKQS